MKILLCFGTRPEAIKMAPVIHELQKRNISYKICITAQHREMLDGVLEFFEINADYDLNLMTKDQNLNYLSSAILKNFDEILEKEMPQIVLVQGDTTTALMAAIATFHRKILLGHIEAGLRTYDLQAPYPEEANRQLISKLTNFHFVPTSKARENLLKEGVHSENILLAGNTIVDALNFGKSKLDSKNRDARILDIEKNIDHSKKIILVTGHRRENLGKGLEQVCIALKELSLSGDVQIIFPVHMNPNVKFAVNKNLSGVPGIHLINPVEYPVFLWLLSIADLIISDSGGIQEEAPSFNKPVIVTREVSERMEGIEAGLAFLTGASSEKIIQTAFYLLNREQSENLMNNPYGDGKASIRIIDYLMEMNER